MSITREDTNTKMERTLDRLFTAAIQKLEAKLKVYESEDSRNMQILKTFFIADMTAEIPHELFNENDVSDLDVACQIVSEKLGKQSNKLTISQIEKYSNSFKVMKTSLQEHNNFIQRQLKKYENEYLRELELTNRDPFDISTLQTYVQKLQADIHHANEEQEQKHVVINKLFDCFEMKRKIDEYEKAKESLIHDVQDRRCLPASIAEAERKLNELKKKYKDVSDEFSKLVNSKV